MILIQFKWVSTYQRISTSEDVDLVGRKSSQVISQHFQTLRKNAFQMGLMKYISTCFLYGMYPTKTHTPSPRGTAATVVADWCLPAGGAITRAEIITASVIRRLDMSFWTPREDEGVRGHDEVDSWHLIPSTHYLIWYKCNNNNSRLAWAESWLNCD